MLRIFITHFFGFFAQNFREKISRDHIADPRKGPKIFWRKRLIDPNRANVCFSSIIYQPLSLSVCPSVCLSVCPCVLRAPFSLPSFHLFAFPANLWLRVQGCQIFIGPNIPKREKYIQNYHKLYQITTNYTKLPYNLPNCHTIYQMAIKIFFHTKALQNIPKLGFLVRK
jgi:hypothetical protein